MSITDEMLLFTSSVFWEAFPKHLDIVPKAVKVIKNEVGCK